MLLPSVEELLLAHARAAAQQSCEERVDKIYRVYKVRWITTLLSSRLIVKILLRPVVNLVLVPKRILQQAHARAIVIISQIPEGQDDNQRPLNY